MLTGEYVDSWNELFPDSQITNSNLDKPTEEFIINALVCYLRRFGYSIETPFELNCEAKENKEARSFRIILSRQIDHFLKITDVRFSFTYFDLLRPTPKKTAHTLYILLNYYYYYNLYKEDVLKVTGEKICRLEELKNRIDNTRNDNVHRRQENINIKSSIESLTEDVNSTRAKLKDLDKTRLHQDEEYEKICHCCQELKEKLDNLEGEKKVLQKRVVPEGEIKELRNQLQQLEIDLAEQKKIELTYVANLNECKESNVKFKSLIKEVEKCYEVIPIARIKQVKETNEKMQQIIREENELKLKQINILKEIEEENSKRLSVEKEQLNRKLEFQPKEKDLKRMIYEKQAALKQKDVEILRLNEEDHISECQLEQQKFIAQYLQESLAQFVSACEE